MAVAVTGPRDADRADSAPAVYGAIADAAGQGTAQRSLQAAGSKRQYLLAVGEEEAGRDFVVAAVKFAVPVRGELIFGVFAGLAHNELCRIPDRS